MPSVLGTPGKDARGLRPGYLYQGLQHFNWCLSTHQVTSSSPGVATPNGLRMSHALISLLWKGFSVLGIACFLAFSLGGNDQISAKTPFYFFAQSLFPENRFRNLGIWERD